MNNQNNIAPINEDLNVAKYNEENIKNMIYTIRGKQVMLDSDLAELYNCANGTKTINQAVKRNIQRFPERFMFQLSEEEYNKMWSQVGTTSRDKTQKYRRKGLLPYAFTEQGIAMLSTVIRTNTAIDVSIRIMDAFAQMRKFLSFNGQIFDRLTSLEYKQIENEKNFNKIFDMLNPKEDIKQKIFFEGQIWDSYSLIIDLIKKAEEKITIIDNYIDDSILKMLAKKNKNVEVAIITSDKSNISSLDVQRFNKEYPILKVSRSNKFHDRFIIIDNKELYHCGASIKDLGKKCFGINKIEDGEIIGKFIV